MAKGHASDSIMGVDKIKPLLTSSKQEPVQAAIALTADGDGLILLDKRKKPRAVMAQLKASAAKAKLQLQPSTLRFGRAEVDTEYDPSMVRFFINKEAPGNMRAPLVEVVKRSAYQKVEFNIDLALELEPEDGEQTEAAATTEPTPQAPDPAALVATLAELVRQMQAVTSSDPTLKVRLLGLANQANTAIKAGELVGAAASLAQIREGLDSAVAQGGATQPSPGDDVLAKLRIAYDKLAPALALAAQASPAIGEAIQERRSAFEAALAASDAATARGHIFELAALSKPGAAVEAAGTIPAGIVEAAKHALDAAQKRWDRAHADAQAGAGTLIAELQSAFPAQAEGFERILDTYWRDLADAINDAKARDPGAGYDDLLQMAGRLRADLMGDALFDYLEGQGVGVRGAFMSGLDALESNIRT